MTPVPAANPFVGLRPFEKGDAHLFFGRDQQVDQLLERLRAGRFVAVLGASGSGKSSLIRAGLLPALEGGFITKAGSAWRLAVLRPGAGPIRSLAAALSQLRASGARPAPPEHVVMLEATIRRGSFGLIEALQEAGLQPGEQVMVVVDQFEELFTFKRIAASTGASDDAALFVKLLLAAARHPDWPVHVVLTMRAEFLGTCSEFRELPEAISDGLFLIPRLNRDQLAQAITGPVAVAGARIAPSLVQRLLNDVGEDPDQLPVLQHALMRMWDHWRQRADGDSLSLQHYEAVGGMREALSNHADEAYHSLSDPQKRFAEKIFKGLTERTAENIDLRRPTSLGELAEIAPASLDETRAVVDVFRADGRSFLTPSAAVAIATESVIDISHESLIRQWKRLSDWVGEESEDRNQYRRIDEAAAGHVAKRESLWRGPALTAALKWRERFKPTAAWARRYGGSLDRASQFLDRSRVNRRLIVGGLAAAFGVVAFLSWQQIEAQHEIEDQRVQAEARAAADRLMIEQGVVEQEKARAEVLAAKYKETESQLRAEKAGRERDEAAAALQKEAERAINALRQSNLLIRADMAARGSARGGETAALVSLHMLRGARKSGDTKASKEAEAALERHLTLIPPLLWKGSIDGAVTALTVTADEQLVVSGDDKIAISDAQIWTAAGKRLAVQGLKVDPLAARVAVSADGGTVVWTSHDTLNRWNRRAGGKLPLLDATFNEIEQLALSPDGRVLLALSRGSIKLWNLESDRATELYRGSATAIALRADGAAAAAVRNGKDTLVELWDGRAPTQLLARIPVPASSSAASSTSSSSPVQKIVFSSKGTYVAVAAGNDLHVWRLVAETPATLRADYMSPSVPLLHHSALISDVVFSADEQLLATASQDHTAVALRLSNQVFAARSADSVKHDLGVNAVAFSPDGQTMATASEDGTARAWNWRGNRWQEVARIGFTKPARAVAFMPDGRLLTGSADKTVKAVALPSQASARSSGAAETPVLEDACRRLTRNLSADEWLEYFTTDPYEPACPNLAADPGELLQLQLKHALNGNAAAARQAFLQYRALKDPAPPDLLDSLLETAKAQASAGNRNEASELMSAAARLALKVEDTSELTDIAILLLELGRKNEADEVLRRVVTLAQDGTDDDPMALVEIALELKGKGHRAAGAGVISHVTRTSGVTDAADLTTLAVAFWEFGKRAEAAQAFVRASKSGLAPATPDASVNNEVCWSGAIHDFAVEVLASCEIAVKNAGNPRSLANYHDSRGVAYALLGKTDLALADFEVFVNNRGPKDPDGKVRAEWVSELKQKNNPFAQNTKEKVLASLRR